MMVKSTMDFFKTLLGNDDPEAPQEPVVAPIAVECCSDSAWQDFQETQLAYEEKFAQSKREKT